MPISYLLLKKNKIQIIIALQPTEARCMRKKAPYLNFEGKIVLKQLILAGFMMVWRIAKS
jgi:hypothetical protein